MISSKRNCFQLFNQKLGLIQREEKHIEKAILKRKSSDRTNPLGNLGVFDLFSDDDDSDDEEDDADSEYDSGGSNHSTGSELHDTNFPNSQESLPSQAKREPPAQPINNPQNVPVKKNTRRSIFRKNS